jgi:hypothetical protein
MRDPAVFDQEGLLYLPRRPWRLVGHMLTNGAALIPLLAVVLFLGMAIYHWAEGLAWDDSFLNAAMLLGGMGPVDQLHTRAGKILAGIYAMFAGVVFLVVAGTMLAPVIHHVLHRFHLESRERERKRDHGSS